MVKLANNDRKFRPYQLQLLGYTTALKYELQPSAAILNQLATWQCS